MGTMTIDGRKVEFTDEKNVLTVIRNAGINIPTLCYHSEVSTFGACRLCTVEDDRGKTFASCSEQPRDGMVIYTNSGRIKKYRKLIVELLLAAHCRDCTTCVKSGECILQELAHRLGVRDIRFENTREQHEIDDSSPSIIRDPNKCILCGNCVRACEELQGIGALGFAFRGTEAMVMPAFNKKIAETQCVNCGQCRVYCPTGAISIRTHMDEVWDALADKDTRVVAQIAPAVRVAVGDHYGLTKGRSVMGKIVNALHRMGFDEVYDTTFSADLTIMEETKEFLNRVEKGENLPLLTSCCPAWVKFITDQYKEYVPNISTDIVITTTELLRMIDNFGLDFATLDPEACDMPFGFGSGGGVIFGVTGGVTEAVLRRLSPDHSKEAMHEIAECGVRGEEGIKEFTVPYKGMDINVCVASGLANARTVMERVKNGEANYHLIEVMACRRGCIMGGGQPTRSGDRTKAARARGLYNADNTMIIKKSDENPLVLELYEGLLKGKEHHLLHNEFYIKD